MARIIPPHMLTMAQKAVAVLEANPGKVYTSTALARACGFSGSVYDQECDAFVKAIHNTKFPNGPLGGYWRNSETRTSPFKDASGARRPSVEWVYDPAKVQVPAEPQTASSAPENAEDGINARLVQFRAMFPDACDAFLADNPNPTFREIALAEAACYPREDGLEDVL